MVRALWELDALTTTLKDNKGPSTSVLKDKVRAR
jgi:hypothetical protein